MVRPALAVLAALLLLPGLVHATTAPATTTSVTNTNVQFNVDQVLSWEFQANANVNVTHLGLWDDLDNGFPLAGGYELALYRVSDQARLTPVGFMVDNSDPLTGHYRYAPLNTPVALTAGQNYLIALYTAPVGTDINDTPEYFDDSPIGTNVTYDPRITVIQEIIENSAGGMMYPDDFTNSTPRMGPTFCLEAATPVPVNKWGGAAAMLAIVLVAGAALVRRTRLGSAVGTSIFGVVLAVSLAAGAASAANLTTGYGGPVGDTGEGSMFDIVVGSQALTLTAVGANLQDNPGVSVWIRTGTHVGNEFSAAGWTQIFDDAVLVANGNGVETTLDVTDYPLAAGTTYGIAIFAPDRQETGPGTGLGNVAASNGDLSILEGIIRDAGYGCCEFGGSSIFSPNVVQTTIYYNVAPTKVPVAGTLVPVLAASLIGAAFWARRRVRS